MYNKGLTFLEIVISLFILAIALVGFLQIFNTALDSSRRSTQEIIATNLARGLLAEIMSKHFEDPESETGSFGIEAGETRHETPAFDDVDDYDGYQDGPPSTTAPLTVGGGLMDGGGSPPRPNYSDFTRNVIVENVDKDLNPATKGSTAYKHITVTVSGPYVKDIIIDAVKVNLPAP